MAPGGYDRENGARLTRRSPVLWLVPVFLVWRGGSGRGGWRAAGGGEQGQPFVFAVPAFGQVQRDVAAAVPGGAGGDVDEVAADGGAAGLAVAEAGQGSGGAQQVVADCGEGKPCGVSRE